MASWAVAGDWLEAVLAEISHLNSHGCTQLRLGWDGWLISLVERDQPASQPASAAPSI
jgi:hypothetical protein